ncbi:hypothetical protein CRE_29937 [Caenorhabditis remanei]|uniref:Uncharacterized protein n=1 Tax=Caenorhabditis remanei TaxID=31234 RepID=E3MM97_CAERE|nr:hypothetical protein CRE_29937 [Caenorhabditis remanei]
MILSIYALLILQFGSIWNSTLACMATNNSAGATTSSCAEPTRTDTDGVTLSLVPSGSTLTVTCTAGISPQTSSVIYNDVTTSLSSISMTCLDGDYLYTTPAPTTTVPVTSVGCTAPTP